MINCLKNNDSIHIIKFHMILSLILTKERQIICFQGYYLLDVHHIYMTRDWKGIFHLIKNLGKWQSILQKFRII
jgi:hypothetical protein